MSPPATLQISARSLYPERVASLLSPGTSLTSAGPTPQPVLGQWGLGWRAGRSPTPSSYNSPFYQGPRIHLLGNQRLKGLSVIPRGSQVPKKVDKETPLLPSLMQSLDRPHRYLPIKGIIPRSSAVREGSWGLSSLAT